MGNIKELFGKNRKTMSQKSVSDLTGSATPVESSEYIEKYIEQKARYLPPVNYATASNFAMFGSAEQYAEDSITRIHQTYPYDGSLTEKTAWFNESNFYDIYIFNHRYPRTCGYAVFSPNNSTGNGWGTAGTAVNSMGLSDSLEYIQVKGGPNADPNSGSLKLSRQFPEPWDGKANVWDNTTGINRESNLALNLNNGVSVEFWIKKPANVTAYETIFDLWNGYTGTAEGNSYGRFHLYAIGASSTLTLELHSGSLNESLTFDSTVNSAVYDGEWHHLAITAKQVVDSDSKYNIEWTEFLDGKFIKTSEDETSNSGADSFGPITGSMIANIGAARIPAFTQAEAAASNVQTIITAGTNDGYGKLSGSIDEFRYWKKARTAQEISRFWFTQIAGGTNTDGSKFSGSAQPVDLGAYFKFNEGNTGNDTIDASVLDYSGRISNGTWTGFVSGSSRVAGPTASAMIESSASLTEFKDPIIYVAHPEVAALSTEMSGSGLEWDLNNNSALYHTMPEWITSEDQTDEDKTLKKLTQIIASYMDTLFLQIKAVPTIGDVQYPYEELTVHDPDEKVVSKTSVRPYSNSPIPFAKNQVEGLGLHAPEIFVAANELAQLANRDEHQEFSQKLYDVKNTIYQNIYNNLVYIYKSKGTEKAFRNLIRCFGVDDELIKINLYADNTTYRLDDANYRPTSIKSKYIDFNQVDRNQSTVYQSASEGTTNSVSYIPGDSPTNLAANGLGSSMTFETDVIFPYKFESAHPSNQWYSFPHLTSSMFGCHEDSATKDAEDFYWTGADSTSDDKASFQVYALRPETDSKDVRFILTSSYGGIPTLTTTEFTDVYDNERWLFSVKVYPESRQLEGPHVSGSGITIIGNSYTIEFQGTNPSLDQVQNSFSLSGTLSSADGEAFMNANKRIYAGAHRQNFSGSLLKYSDVKVGAVRVWDDYLTDSELKTHALDPTNFGRARAYKGAHLFNQSTNPDSDSSFIPQFETLLLNWDFAGITGSSNGAVEAGPGVHYGGSAWNSSFDVVDASSGSDDKWSVDDKYKYHYTGRGDYFLPSVTKVSDLNFLYAAKTNLPEVMAGADTVNILDKDDDYFTRDSVPANHYFAIEKSMYQTISEEMLNMFATTAEFNNIIGEPANRYRPEYKALGKLREAFFRKISNTPDFNKFVDYYKWIDDSLTTMLMQLVPATANFSDGVKTMIESHILERNKYWTKFPTLEMKAEDPTGFVKGISELTYDWKHGHAPIPAWTSAGGAVWAVSTTLSDYDGKYIQIISTDGTTRKYVFDDDGDQGVTGAEIDSSTPKQICVQIQGISGGAAAIRKAIADELMTAIKSSNGHGTKISEGSSSAGGPNYKLLLVQTGLGAGGNTSITTDVASSAVAHMVSFTSGVGDTDSNCLWWKERAEAMEASDIDTDRNTLRRILTSDVTTNKILATGEYTDPTDYPNSGFPNAAQFNLSQDGDNLSARTQYKGSTYALRRFSKPYKMHLEKSLNLHGGTNPPSNNKGIDYLWSTHRAFSNAASTDSTIFNLEGSSVGGDADYNLKESKCADNITPIEIRKIKRSSETQPYATSDATDSIKSILVAPFQYFSQSSDIATSRAMLDVDNNTAYHGLHDDSYSELNETPIQGPFTQAHVGGRQYRHFEASSSFLGTDHNDSNRAEGYRVAAVGEIVYGPRTTDLGASAPQNAAGMYYRDEVAKRPLNIRNIQSTTASNALGNYDRLSQIVTTNADESMFYARLQAAHDDAGLHSLLSGTSSPIISDTHDFAKLRAVGKTVLDSNTVLTAPYDSTQVDPYLTKHSIIERFSAPGGPDTAGDAFGGFGIDRETNRYAVYNALPWRNLAVRTPLNAMQTAHCARYGSLSGSALSATDVTTAGTASFHKVHRNSDYDTRLSGDIDNPVDQAECRVIHDNWFIQHPIPANDYGYAWITASADKDTGCDTLTTASFVTASSFASWYYTDSGRIFGADVDNPPTYGIMTSVLSQPVFTDFVGINHNIYEPVTSSANVLGYPNHTLTGVDADVYYNSNYTNQDFVGGLSSDDEETIQAVGYGGVGGTLNAINLHRNGPYGYPSWKQIRTGNHPVAREHKKNNIISVSDTPATRAFVQDVGGQPGIYTVTELKASTHTNYIEPPLSIKHNPLIHSVVSTADGIPQNIRLKHSYANNLTTFSNVGLANKVSVETARRQVYDDLKDAYLASDDSALANPIKAFKALTYKETIYPREAHTFLKNARGRTAYAQTAAVISASANGTYRTFWRDNIADRKREDGALNSMGYPICESPNHATNAGAAAMWYLGTGSLSSWPLDTGSPRTILTGAIAGGWMGVPGQGAVSRSSDGTYNEVGAIIPFSDEYGGTWGELHRNPNASIFASVNSANLGQIGELRATGSIEFVSTDKSHYNGKYIILETHGITHACTTNSTTTLSLITSNHLIQQGIFVYGDGIPAGAYISSMTYGATSCTLSAAATASTTGVELTFTHKRKFIFDDDNDQGATGAEIGSTAPKQVCVQLTNASGHDVTAYNALSSGNKKQVLCKEFCEAVMGDVGLGSGSFTGQPLIYAYYPDYRVRLVQTGSGPAGHRAITEDVGDTAKLKTWSFAGGDHFMNDDLFKTHGTASVAFNHWELVSDGQHNNYRHYPTGSGDLWEPWISYGTHAIVKYDDLGAGISGFGDAHRVREKDGGDAQQMAHWATAYWAGRNPWHDSYEKYSDDIRSMGKDYSIVPEFRISEHMDYYIDKGRQAQNFKFLSLEGAAYTSSADTELSGYNEPFWKEYCHSDFMDSFSTIQRDHEGIAETGVISLQCHAIKKLLPYDGFYPVQRTVQLGALLSSSFGPFISGSSAASYGPDTTEVINENGRDKFFAERLQSLLQPFYAPGIMYNTIKSGIAVDYPIHTSSADLVNYGKRVLSNYKDRAYNIDGSNMGYTRAGSTETIHERENINLPNLSHSGSMQGIAKPPDMRLPFEAILSPERYLPVTSNNAESPDTWEPARAYFSGHADLASDNDNKLVITNTDGTSVTFTTDSSKTETQSTATLIGTSGVSTTAKAAQSLHVAFTAAIAASTLKMKLTPSAYTDETRVRLTQNTGGPAGNTLIHAQGNLKVNGQFAYNKMPAFFGGKDTSKGRMYLTSTSFGSSSFYCTWDGNRKPNYSLAAHNFCAEVPNFFLKNQTFTTFRSKPENKFVPMTSGTTYYMDVMMHKSSDFDMQFHGGQGFVNRNLKAGWGFGPRYGVMMEAATDALDEPFVTNNDVLTNLIGFAHDHHQPNYGDPAFAPHCPPYFYGSSIARLAFVPHESMDMAEGTSMMFSVDDILSNVRTGNGNANFGATADGGVDPNSQTSYFAELGYGVSPMLSAACGLLIANSHYGPNPQINAVSPANKAHMRLSSSVNLFGKTFIPAIQYDPVTKEPVGASEQGAQRAWVIQSKFECPTLNFATTTGGGISVSEDPAHGGGGIPPITASWWKAQSASDTLTANYPGIAGTIMQNVPPAALRRPIGMWNGYGEVPTGGSGIFLSLKESYPDKNSHIREAEVSNTGSLLQMCGFEPEARRIGELAESKWIHEAVVAIPFVEIEGNRKFFALGETPTHSRLLFQDALAGKDKAGQSLRKMAEQMPRYVIPPHLDFSVNRNIEPFAMYIFEFSEELSQQDLSHIWQNILPDIGVTAKKSTTRVAHVSAENEFFRGMPIPENTRWMVFKVKQRANINYFRVTEDTTDNHMFRFEYEAGGHKRVPRVSYNWPYDFFSLIELVKIDAGVGLGAHFAPFTPTPGAVTGPDASSAVTAEAAATATSVDVGGGGILDGLSMGDIGSNQGGDFGDGGMGGMGGDGFNF